MPTSKRAHLCERENPFSCQATTLFLHEVRKQLGTSLKLARRARGWRWDTCKESVMKVWESGRNALNHDGQLEFMADRSNVHATPSVKTMSNPHTPRLQQPYHRSSGCRWEASALIAAQLCDYPPRTS